MQLYQLYQKLYYNRHFVVSVKLLSQPNILPALLLCCILHTQCCVTMLLLFCIPQSSCLLTPLRAELVMWQLSNFPHTKSVSKPFLVNRLLPTQHCFLHTANCKLHITHCTVNTVPYTRDLSGNIIDFSIPQKASHFF